MLQRTEAPTIFPITVPEVKKAARIYIAADDGYLQGLIAAANEKWELESRFYLAEQTWLLTKVPASIIHIPERLRPILSVVSITYLDDAEVEQTVDSETYTLTVDEHGRGCVELEEVPQAAKITIEFTVGFPNPEGEDPHTAPELAKQAVKMLVAHWYRNREAFAEKSLGPVRASWESIKRNYSLT